MAKIHFTYGTVGAGKTAHALMLNYQLKQTNKNVLMVKPATDTRTDKVWSRIGLEADCVDFDYIRVTRGTKYRAAKDIIARLKDVHFIIVDEVQFLQLHEIEALTYIADELDITIFAYGLLKDFNNRLFKGSKCLIEVADELHEIKSVCWCGHHATHNGLVEDGKLVKNNSKSNIQIEQVGEQRYIPLCRKHYEEGRIQ